MKKWIRWQGLLVFLGISVLLFFFNLFFLDGIVKRTIEKYGTKAIGAQVEMDSVDVSLFPLGIRFTNLQVTDPDAPLKNAVQIEDANFSMEPLHLLRRKVVIKEAVVNQVQFNTPRKTSGAIKSDETKAAPVDSSEKKSDKDDLTQKKLPAFELPDIDAILQKEKLLSLEEINILQSDIQKEQEQFETQLKALPNEKSFEQYQKRIEKLKVGKGGIEGLLRIANDVSSLQKEIEKDIASLENAQTNLQKTSSTLENRIRSASKRPFEDFNRIKSKYTLSPEGVGNIAGLIIGPKYSGWIENGLVWYKKIAPALSKRKKDTAEEVDAIEPIRGKGVNIRFKEQTPFPNFLIKTIDVSSHIETGHVAGNISNITNDQSILGVPLTFEFSGQKLIQIKAVSLFGALNHVVPDNSLDFLEIKAKEYKIQNLSLSDHSEVPLTLQKGLADLDMKATVQGERIDSNLDVNFHSVQFLSESKNKENTVSNAINQALAKVTHFTITAKIKGTIDKNEVTLQSDLDRIIKDAVSNIIKEKTAAFEKELKSAIFSKTDKKRNSMKGDMKSFSSLEKELSDRLGAGDDVLGSVKKL